MAMRTHLVIPDQHAHFQHNNRRADLLGRLMYDLRPDVVVNIGDAADMPSLSSYDRGRKSFQGRTYAADVASHLDFQDRLWHQFSRHKKRKPVSFALEGNHEHRIVRAIEIQPELEGSIGMGDLQFRRYYDEFIPYEGSTPGIVEVDGVSYAHYFISGVAGRNISGEHPATSLLTKKFSSSTCGHSHTADWSTRTLANGRRIMGCFVGCYFDYDADWAGVMNSLYWRGVMVAHNVEDGCYDPQFISLRTIEQEYG